MTFSASKSIVAGAPPNSDGPATCVALAMTTAPARPNTTCDGPLNADSSYSRHTRGPTPAEEREARNTRSHHRHSMSAGAPRASHSRQPLAPPARGCRHLAERLVDLWTWRGILWMSRALQPFLMRPAPDQPGVIHRHARGVPQTLESIRFVRFVRSIRPRHPAHPTASHSPPRARKSEGEKPTAQRQKAKTSRWRGVRWPTNCAGEMESAS